MKNIVRTGTHFTRPDFDIDEKLKHSIGVYGGDTPELVHLRLSVRSAIWFGERKFHGTQEFTLHPDGTAELKMNVALNPEVERLILGWGSQLEVLGPPSLRQKIWDEAMAIVNRGAALPRSPE